VKSLLAVWSLVVVVPVFGFSQAGTGQIQGVCRDPEGAAIPGVTVAIRETQTGAERVVKTDETGRFAAPFMPVGTYSVQPEFPGMATRSRTELVLTVGAIWTLLWTWRRQASSRKCQSSQNRHYC